MQSEISKTRTRRHGEIAVAAPELDGDDDGFDDDAIDDPHARAKRILRRLRPLLHLVTAAVFLGIWQLLSTASDGQIWVSSPSLIWHQLVNWTQSGYLMKNVLVTLKETLLGFLFGSAAGVITGVFFGLMPVVAWVLDPFISAFYCIPQVALAPLFVLWFGIELQMKVILAAVIVYFLVHTNTYAGVRSRDRELIDVVRVMGASRRQVVLSLVLPGARLNIFTGLKLAVPYALVGAVFGEIVSSNQGLGYLIIAASNQFDTTGLMTALVVVMIIGAVLKAIVDVFEHRFERWRS
jgi:NitT/TauT family transport system permease protein